MQGQYHAKSTKNVLQRTAGPYNRPLAAKPTDMLQVRLRLFDDRVELGGIGINGAWKITKKTFTHTGGKILQQVLETESRQNVSQKPATR
jgi:hypothetical protein